MQKHRYSVVILIAAFSFFTTSLCTAQTHKQEAIDDAYEKCLAADTSCANIGDCAFIAYGKWEKEMNDTYKKLLKALKKEKDKAALKQSQAAWVAYRDATFKSYDMMFNRPGGKWCRLRHDDRIDMVRARAIQLRNYMESLKKK